MGMLIIKVKKYGCVKKKQVKRLTTAKYFLDVNNQNILLLFLQVNLEASTSLDPMPSAVRQKFDILSDMNDEDSYATAQAST